MTQAETSTAPVADAFAWLGQNDDATLAWQEAQNEAALARLRALGDLDGAVSTFRSLLREVRIFPPRQHGERWFQQQYRGDEGRAVLVAGAAPGAGDVLADGGGRSLDYYVPSPDGAHVAIGWSEGGTEQSVIEVVETASGNVQPFRAAGARMATIAWLRDGSGFYYDAVTPAGRRLFLHRLGEEDATEQALPYRPGLVRARVSADGAAVIVFAGYPNLVPVAWARAGEPGAWTPLLSASTGTFSGDIVGDHLVAATTEGAANGRVVGIPLATADDRATWREIVAETGAVIDTAAVVANHIVVGALLEGAARIVSYRPDGTRAGEATLPEHGAVTMRPIQLSGVDPMFHTTGDEIFFLSHDLLTPFRGCAYAPAAGELTVTVEARALHPDLTVERTHAVSADGTRIPIEIIARRDRAGATAAMVHAYAGPYGLLPGYNWDLNAFAEAGGALAIVHTRGGTEYGQAWFAAGGGGAGGHIKMDDIRAATSLLVERGIADPARIGFVGASAGGIIGGIALTQPDTPFALVCPQYAFFDYAALLALFAPKGTLDDEAHAALKARVMALSPVHAGADARAYPASFIMMGGRDPLTPPGSSRRMAAQLQANDPARDHLLRVYGDVGHVTSPTLAGLADLAAEWLVFCRALLLDRGAAERGA